MANGELTNHVATSLVPLEVGEHAVYLEVRELGQAGLPAGEEREIFGGRPSLDQVLDGLMGLARAMGARLQQSNASTVRVQFGCEVALETGTFVAVIGKASAKSTFTVELEWNKEPS